MNNLEDILNAAENTAAALATSAAELGPSEAPAPAPAEKPAKAKKEKAAKEKPDVVVPDLVTVEGDLGDLLKETPAEAVQETIVAVAANFDNRAAFERDKGANEKKIAKIDAYKAKLTTQPAVAMLMATSADLNFMNRATNSKGTSRFNIYAIDKLADLVMGLNTGHFKNAVNIAVMKSLFKFRTANEPFTGELASAAVSDKIRVADKFKAILVRHTVDQSTADTQASSTLNALKVLGVVENIGTRSAQIWRLTDTPQTRRLEELLAA